MFVSLKYGALLTCKTTVQLQISFIIEHFSFGEQYSIALSMSLTGIDAAQITPYHFHNFF